AMREARPKNAAASVATAITARNHGSIGSGAGSGGPWFLASQYPARTVNANVAIATKKTTNCISPDARLRSAPITAAAWKVRLASSGMRSRYQAGRTEAISATAA